MRLMPSRYADPRPTNVKNRAQVSQVKHLQAPLKGLNLDAKLVSGDPLTAPVLTNWVVEEARICARPGTKQIVALADTTPVEALVPYYGTPDTLAAACGGKLYGLDGTVLKSGFTSNDWHWTAFSNLSQTDYTVMVNGKDGVWSWDGDDVPAGTSVAVTSLSNTNPARVTVSSANIAKFKPGASVTIAGATGTGLTAANGTHVIGAVGSPANTFTLVGVDTSSGAAPQTSGVTAAPQGSFVKEAVTAPAGSTHINTENLQIVLSHMNRLWFADSTYLSVYYLPLQQKSGELTELPLNAIFKRGGTIRAMYTWTLDGGMGLDDQLVIFSSNGEAAIYAGIDPDTEMQLIGVYRFDSPMSKHSVVNYGGELYALISTGLVPMSTLIREESESLGKQDKAVFTEFDKIARQYRDRPGWAVMLNHSSGRIYCNMPLGSVNKYRQMIRFMPKPVWAAWDGLPARCWGWVDNRVFFGTDDGKVKELNPSFLNDDGQPIRIDVQMAWSAYGTPALKHFKMLKPYIQTDGQPRPMVDMKVDYDPSVPFNQPEVSIGTVGAVWDEAVWDEADWAAADRVRNWWSGVAIKGNVGAPRLTALIKDCNFSLSGWDVVYETGAVVG